MDELQTLYDQLMILMNEIQNKSVKQRRMTTESQISFNIFYQNLPDEIKAFIHEFYYPTSYSFDYLMIVFKGIFVIAKHFIKIQK